MSVDRPKLIELRELTKAGMSDCLRALAEASGDLDRAAALLKERGLAAVEDRSGREAAEGRVFLRAGGARAAMAELGCETDFAARSEPFAEAGERIVELAYDRGADEAAPEAAAIVAELGRVVREKVELRRLACIACSEGERLSVYLHGEGEVGAVVRWRAEGAEGLDDERAAAFFHDAALHVAAFAPRFVDEASIGAERRAEMAEVFRRELEAEPASASKPPALREAILAGRLRKRLAAATLLTQGFVRDDKIPFASALRRLEAESGHAFEITGFERFAARGE